MADTELLVFQITGSDSKCDACGGELWRGGMLFKEGPKGLCLECAELDHLAFLGAGDACVTRRARKYSPISVVVLKWSRARRRYERQGLLVSEGAVERAEEECLDDAALRERRQMAAALRRERLDEDYVRSFAAAVRRRYPAAPQGAETKIAEHACRKHSGRVGRTAAAKELDETAIDLAVRAHARHAHTRYDELLMQGEEREHARASVRSEIEMLLEQWKTG
jgi:hypothetical protein